ncbi:uncharacterized protein [Nicotiana tomentosiformis]|uniref:uncharacterized protein n=1 Tax=Nicotiana tomentosiformis TaxID=4098 RepID=UPI00388CE282
MIHVPPNELNATSAPWPFAAWGMDVIGPTEPAASNGHRFIFVAIDYLTKWVKAASYKAVTKKVVADFVRDHIVCRFGVPESIITDNATNLNIDLMNAMCETLKIKHKNSTAYRPLISSWPAESQGQQFWVLATVDFVLSWFSLNCYVPQLLSTLPYYHLCYSELLIPSRLKAKAIKALATHLPSVNTAQGSFETLVNSDTLGFGP